MSIVQTKIHTVNKRMNKTASKELPNIPTKSKQKYNHGNRRRTQHTKKLSSNAQTKNVEMYK